MNIIVIGAGLLGLSSAYHLAVQGHRVVVLDRREGPGLETSFANAGMVTPSQAEPWNVPGILGKVIRWLGREDAPVLVRPSALGPMFFWGLRFLRHSSLERFCANALANARLARMSIAALHELRRNEALDYGQICRGTLKIYRDPRAMEEGVRVADLLAAAGVTRNILGSGAIPAVEPALADVAGHLAGAIHFPDDESGDAHRFCRALAAMLPRRGVDIRGNTEVTGFRRRGARVLAVDTPLGPMEADVFVLCAGSGSAGLGRAAGMHLPIQPVKGYSITVSMTGWSVIPRMPIVDDARHAALTPMDGRLRVAGTAEFAGFDTTLSPGRIRNLRRVVAEVFPRFAPCEDADLNPWAGLRPYVYDGVPIIGRMAMENLFVNSGHGHLGWTLAAGSGKLLSQLVCGTTPEIDPSAYRPDRF